MMTATATPTGNLLARIKQEQAAENDAGRRRAISELQEVRDQLAKVVQPLDEKVKDAEMAFVAAEAQAKRLVSEAQQLLNHARLAKLAGTYPIERRREILEFTLQCELQHPAIRAALETVAEISEAARQVVIETDSVEYWQSHPEGEMRARRIPKPAGEVNRSANVIAWCQSAQAALTDLQFVDSDDIPGAVAATLDTQP